VIITRCAGLKNVSHGATGCIGISPALHPYSKSSRDKSHHKCLRAALPDYRYVMKTNVKRYSESIDHTLWLRQLDKDIADPAPDKTSTGGIAKGFDFLGDHFDSKHLTVAAEAAEKPVDTTGRFLSD
jgi:hypothetical protein